LFERGEEGALLVRRKGEKAEGQGKWVEVPIRDIPVQMARGWPLTTDKKQKWDLRRSH